MRKEHYLNHIRIFPQGQFVGVKGNQVISMTTTIRYPLIETSDHTFLDVPDNRFLNTHQAEGYWLYGMDMGTHPNFRNKGIAEHLYHARQKTVKKLGLKGQYTYGMLSGYGAHKQKMPATEYNDNVLTNKLKDPTVDVMAILYY